jgi:hypothetical protein
MMYSTEFHVFFSNFQLALTIPWHFTTGGGGKLWPTTTVRPKLSTSRLARVKLGHNEIAWAMQLPFPTIWFGPVGTRHIRPITIWLAAEAISILLRLTTMREINLHFISSTDSYNQVLGNGAGDGRQTVPARVLRLLRHYHRSGIISTTVP